jgi:hypothetical protein
VNGDAGEPRRERGPPRELVEVQVRVQVGLLHHVLGVRFVAQDGAGDAEETLVVPAHQNLEEPFVSGLDAAHELFVGGDG